MHSLPHAIERYVQETLGFGIKCRSWSGAASMPYFLQDVLTVWEANLLGTNVLIAVETHATDATISETVKRIRQVSALAQMPVVYATEALASYERKRLIEHKLPFIVPGNQLYLPDLGLDLREYFRQRASTTSEPLSPSAQAMLIAVLLQPIWEAECQPNELLENLGYSAMTRSRTIRELIATGIAIEHKIGRVNQLKLARSPRETWHHARSLMRSPIKRTVWAYPGDIPTGLAQRTAGLSALAQQTQLTAPRQSVHAISHAAWLAAKGPAVELPEPLPGADEWQLWNYPPSLLPMTNSVDPCSLILSLRAHPDERVQQALDDISGQLPW